MRHLQFAAVVVLLAACGASGDTVAVPSPFPDVPLAGLDELGADGDVTEVITWDAVVVADSIDGPRAFRRADPNNGCRLALASDADDDGIDPDAVFFDFCHGNQYDSHGRPLGDSAPRTMEPLPIEVRDDEVVLVRAEERARFEREIAAQLATP